MQIQTRIKNYSLEEMCTTVSNISKVRFQMAYKKTYITPYNIYQFKKFLDEKFVVYKLPFPHSIKYIHLSGQKISTEQSGELGLGKSVA